MWNECSVSCGVGLQTRSVWCVRSVGANHSEAALNSECRGPRPTEVQACNQVQCVPTWETDEWQEVSPCTHTHAHPVNLPFYPTV